MERQDRKANECSCVCVCISVPLQVLEFGAPEVGTCVAARASRGASTWITFIGDSNQRQKIHSFLDFLPQNLNYSYLLDDEEVRSGGKGGRVSYGVA